MKLNNKGFVASGVIYALLILFLTLLLGLLAMFSSRKMILDKLKNDVLGDVTPLLYNYYEDGTPIYFNPVTGNLCMDYSETYSKTSVKSGCLKWYAFGDEGIDDYDVNLILDHNISIDSWNSSEDNTKGMAEIAEALKSETSSWTGIQNIEISYDGFDYSDYKARLITADEIAKVVKSSNWNSSNNNASWMYLDSAFTNSPQTQIDTCKVGNITECKYGWIYDRTSSTCENNGCLSNSTSDQESGYWTSTPTYGDQSSAWIVKSDGTLNRDVINSNKYGVRPVITIKKDLIKLEQNTQVVYEYTGGSQLFAVPTFGYYKLELWGAQGGDTPSAFGGKGAYASGIISLKSGIELYLYLGGSGNKSSLSNTGGTVEIMQGGYNGGGNSANQPTCCDTRYWGSGGGATDVRLVSGDWNSFDSLKSRIMVAAGGGGSFSTNDTYLSSANGGAGGSLNGIDASGNNGYAPGKGATQINGGEAVQSTKSATLYSVPGGFGLGGSKNNSSSGGGSGYYGGSGSGHVDASGGGSSYISGYTGCKAISEDSTSTNITHTDQPNHYSGYIFNSSSMIPGNEFMPTHDGTSEMPGNSGNGYAKITYCGETSNSCK